MMMYELLVVILILVLAVTGFHVWSTLRYRRLKRRRIGVGLDDFLQEVGHLASDRVVQGTYKYFSGLLPRGTPVLASDGLYEMFGIAGSDLPTEIEGAADACGVPRPSEEECYRAATVADVVRLLGKSKAADEIEQLGVASFSGTRHP